MGKTYPKEAVIVTETTGIFVWGAVMAVALAGLIVNDVSVTGKQAYAGILESSNIMGFTSKFREGQSGISTYRYRISDYAESCNAMIYRLEEEIYDAQREVNDCKTAVNKKDAAKIGTCLDDLEQRRQEVLEAEQNAGCFEIMMVRAPQYSEFSQSEILALQQAVVRIQQEIQLESKVVQGEGI